MALEHMYQNLKDQAEKNVENQVNAIKSQITKELVAFGEEFEKNIEIKKKELDSSLNKKESLIQAEKQFAYRSTLLDIEKKLINNTLLELEQQLLLFKNSPKYVETMNSWFLLAKKEMSNAQITVTVDPSDKDMFKFDDATINTAEHIQAGFIMSSSEGEIIDLSFRALFNDKKQQLLQDIMPIIKEILWS